MAMEVLDQVLHHRDKRWSTSVPVSLSLFDIAHFAYGYLYFLTTTIIGLCIVVPDS